MRVLVLLAIGVLAITTYKLFEVGPTAYGGLVDPWLALPVAVVSYLLYGVGLPLLLLVGAAHVGLRRARRRILESERGAGLGAAAALAGLVLLAGLWRIIWLNHEAIPAEFVGDRNRYLVVASVTTAHVTLAGVLLVALGVRIARIRPTPTAKVHAPAGAGMRR